LKAGLDWQKLDRWCNGSWIDCVDAAKTRETTLRGEWRGTFNDELNAKLGYAYSQRRVSSYNENAFLALVPMANVSPTGATGGATAYSFMNQNGWTGYGPLAGFAATTGNMNLFFPSNNALANAMYGNQNRISELPGMRRYNMADRNRDKLRSSLNWQAGEQLSLQGGLDYNNDDYDNSVYGLKKARSWALNLDGTYAFNDNLSLTAFYSFEDQRSQTASNSYTANSNAANVNGATAISGGCFATIALRNLSNKIDPCLNWSTDMRDKVDTLGFSLRHKGMMSGKLDLGGDLIFTRARTDIGVNGGNYVNNPLAVAGAPAGTIAAYFIGAAALPTVTTNTVELRLTGKYALDAASWVRLGYGYARMKSSDYAYDAMQYGGLAGVLPSNEQAPNYTVQSISAAYLHAF
jgi:hypothetical protein